MTPPLANPPCASQLETAVNLTDRRLLSFPFVGVLPAGDPAAVFNLPSEHRRLYFSGWQQGRPMTRVNALRQPDRRSGGALDRGGL